MRLFDIMTMKTICYGLSPINDSAGTRIALTTGQTIICSSYAN